MWDLVLLACRKEQECFSSFAGLPQQVETMKKCWDKVKSAAISSLKLTLHVSKASAIWHFHFQQPTYCFMLLAVDGDHSHRDTV